ncbi:hypothetical protein AGIG_G18995 [Arapaima gigas]
MFFSTKSSVRRKTCSASRQKECGSITERRCQEGPGRPFPVGNTAGRRRTRGRQRGARRRTAVPCNLPDKCYLLSGPSEKLSKGRGPPSRGVTSLPDNSRPRDGPQNVLWSPGFSPTPQPQLWTPACMGGARQPRVAGGSPQEDPEPPPKRSNCSAASKVEQEHPRLETASSAPSPEGSTFGECNT